MLIARLFAAVFMGLNFAALMYLGALPNSSSDEGREWRADRHAQFRNHLVGTRVDSLIGFE